MRILEALRPHLDELEQDEPNAHQFVERLLIQHEEGRHLQLTGPQFSWLNDLHQRYCK